ncbi:hypothetical protein ACFB49_35080 [Sphingomonas sp. DBB INV C78]|uniref:serine hydrolase domain-containing protein n=1 Tax=Sphingomonas sp. DBB INV C78 TaxID=3349434 RepID=UPI0036D26614
MKLLAAAIALMLPGMAHAADGARADAAIAAAGFQGVALIGQGDRITYERAAGDVRPGEPHQVDSLWRLASVTKQLAALIVMQEVAAGTIDLESPVRTWWPEWPARDADKITVRMLLRHESGLPDPGDTGADGDEVPAFYIRKGAEADPLRAASAFCAGAPRGMAPMDFHYNNCDYMVLGALLQKVTGKPFADLLAERIAMPLGLSSLGLFPFDAPAPANVPGMNGKGIADPAINLGTYGAAGSAYIRPRELWAVDRALMENRLLDRIQTSAMWTGEPGLGFAALGAWSYSVPLKGCPDPVALIERRGAIDGVQVRNFLAPERRVAVILFTNRGDFDYGEVAGQSGFAHAMLAAALCPEP